MSNTETKFKFKVNVIESESGWGQKIDEVVEFDTYEEAVAYIEKTNAKNNQSKVPEIYWRAEPANFNL